MKICTFPKIDITQFEGCGDILRDIGYFLIFRNEEKSNEGHLESEQPQKHHMTSKSVQNRRQLEFIPQIIYVVLGRVSLVALVNLHA